MAKLPSRRASVRHLVLAAPPLLALTSPADAETRTWVGPTSSTFSNPINWSPPAIPGLLDSVLFDLSNSASHTVALTANTTNDSLLLSRGNLTLNLGTFAYSLTGAASPALPALSTLAALNATSLSLVGSGPFTAPSLTVGQAPTILPPGSFVNANLTTNVPTTITGSLIVGNSAPGAWVDARFNANAPTTVGGSLTVGNGAFGVAAFYAPATLNSVTLGANGGQGTLRVNAPVNITSNLNVGTTQSTSGNIHLDRPEASLHVGGAVTIGQPTATWGGHFPPFGMGTVFVTQGQLAATGNISVAPESYLHVLTPAASVQAAALNNSGSLITERSTLPMPLTNNGIFHINDTTLTAPFSQTNDGSLVFTAWSLPTVGPLHLDASADLRGTLRLSFAHNSGFSPHPGDRFDLIRSPSPLDLSKLNIVLGGLVSTPAYHLDTSQGLSIIFDATAEPAMPHGPYLTFNTTNGSLNTPSNWTHNAAPSSESLARFASGTHSVWLDADLHAGWVVVEDGTVSLDLRNRTLSFANYFPSHRALQVGSSVNANAYMALSNGSISIPNISVGNPFHNGDSAGTLTVLPSVTLTVGTADIGVVGDLNSEPQFAANSPGVHADGTLIIDHASATFDVLNVARSPNATGRVIFIGPSPAGTPATVSQRATIGAYGGHGTLELRDGAALHVAQLEAGVDDSNATGSGALVITGQGSALTADQTSLGAPPTPSGLATLTVADHASFTTENLTLMDGSSASLAASATLTTRLLNNTGQILFTAPTALLKINTPTSSKINDVRSQLLDGRLATTLSETRLAYYLTTAIPAQLIVRPALPGDVDLSGTITPADFAAVDASFAAHLSNRLWTHGDFTYDGLVTTADYLIIDRTYLLLPPPPADQAALLAARHSQFGPAYVQQLLTSIPEPSLPTACGLALLLPLLLRQRKTIPTSRYF